jgi:hypothetical protein
MVRMGVQQFSKTVGAALCGRPFVELGELLNNTDSDEGTATEGSPYCGFKGNQDPCNEAPNVCI